jgi:mono/diheme cytochrome c family protein
MQHHYCDAVTRSGARGGKQKELTCDMALASAADDDSNCCSGDRPMRSHPIAAAIILALTSPAFAAPPDPTQGEQIARRWCAACHVVSADQKQANADVPSFANIAKRKTNGDLTSFLTDPHPKMPDMSLSRQEIADITAYIRSLAAPGGQ